MTVQIDSPRLISNGFGAWSETYDSIDAALEDLERTAGPHSDARWDTVRAILETYEVPVGATLDSVPAAVDGLAEIEETVADLVRRVESGEIGSLDDKVFVLHESIFSGHPLDILSMIAPDVTDDPNLTIRLGDGRSFQMWKGKWHETIAAQDASANTAGVSS